MAEKDWLEGCVPWSGKEKTLPTGAILPPKVNVLRLIKSWTALRTDGEVVSGLKTADLLPGDIVVGAEPNNAAIRAILKTYGEDAFRIIDSYGRHLKPAAWVRRYKTNPFTVLAIMRKLRG
jgi:hypothetical protein